MIERGIDECQGRATAGTVRRGAPMTFVPRLTLPNR
jgi:hypothetical protein